MELCDNKTLKDMIEEMKKDPYFLKKNQDDDNLSLLGYYLTNEIFEEILEGVSYLHEKKIIHRDLKPDNILFKQSSISDKFVKIADFGLITIHAAKKKAELEQQKIDQQLNAIELELAEETHTANMGAREYAAPEKISGANYDHRVDIYSLGIILKEIFFIDINRFFILDFDFLTNLKLSN
jgi:serine/threonine protein kinase